MLRALRIGPGSVLRSPNIPPALSGKLSPHDSLRRMGQLGHASLAQNRNYLSSLQPSKSTLSYRTLTSTFHQARTIHSSGQNFQRYTRFGQSEPSGNGLWDNLKARFGNDRSTYVAIFLFTTGGVYYVYHLERIPESGRWRFIDVSRAKERKEGKAAFAEIMQAYQNKILPPNHPASKYVRQVAERILASTGMGHVKQPSMIPSIRPAISGLFGEDPSDADDRFSSSLKKKDDQIAENDEWEVFVVNDPATVNAFVLPGGKIFVFTGILPVAKNDDGLASVLGHEIAHQVLRHSAERMSSSRVLFALVILLEILGLDVGLSRLGLNLLLTLPNSRGQEAEADAVGLNLMSKACFDPREASQMWVRMAKAEQGDNEDGTSSSTRRSGLFAWLRALGKSVSSVLANTDFLSTHPASNKRVKAMEEQIPDALAIRAAAPGCANILEGQYDDFRTLNTGLGGGTRRTGPYGDPTF